MAVREWTCPNCHGFNDRDINSDEQKMGLYA
nr:MULTISPECIES: hypothetical protein [Sporolactobacillaceae]